MILYLPVYLVFAGDSLAKAPWKDIVLQATVQGLLTAIISLFLYGEQ